MIQKDRYSFIAIFHYADDGISISFPDLEGCYPCAETEDEAFKNAREALGLHLWGMEQDKEEIPTSTPLKDIQLEDGEIPVMVDVFMPPVRERINNKFVKKTLSLPAWLAALADKDNINCSKIFQNALIEYLNIDINTKQPLNKLK